MHQAIRTATGLAVAILASVVLTACGSLSKHIESDGSGAEQLVWPEPDSTTPMHNNGTWPSLSALRRIHSGMTKNQIADLIGAPHFGEGAWFVREWNYLFHIPTDQGSRVCQYKILFDEDSQAGSFYWKPTSCGALLEKEPVSEKVTLSTDAVFDFDSAELTGEGYDDLQRLVAKVREHRNDLESIYVVGHTDRRGDESYNKSLSQRRAVAVMRYLKDQGVPTRLMSTAGRGEADPVKTDCGNGLTPESEIDCLAPNRRVEVTVSASR